MFRFLDAFSNALESLGVNPHVLSALMELVQHDDEIAAAIRTLLAPLRETVSGLLGAAMGPDHPSIDLIVDSIPGSFIFRSVLLGQPATPTSIADEVVALVERVRA